MIRFQKANLLRLGFAWVSAIRSFVIMLPLFSIIVQIKKYGDGRWWSQPWWVKVLRIIRYWPRYKLIFLWRLIRWAVTGFKSIGGMECCNTLDAIITSTKAEYDYALGKWHTTNEIMADLEYDKRRKALATEVPLDSIKHRLKR